eukprot:gnl/Chilomastix_caulleri/2843.p1 GENE.gnl/Chilomastix_caulleri/2843~~gnl/Chilomastix_caulleri/2843.p1  ORF type:complete len:109 (+),score=14.54 gnl/Chilomastix_caulleri/2843:65-391(+)
MILVLLAMQQVATTTTTGIHYVGKGPKRQERAKLGVDTVRVFKRTMKMMAVHELYRSVLSRPLTVVVRASGSDGVWEESDGGDDHRMLLTQRSRYLQRFLESINSVLG